MRVTRDYICKMYVLQWVPVVLLLLQICFCFVMRDMRESRKFCQRGSNYENVILVDEGWEDPNTTIFNPWVDV